MQNTSEVIALDCDGYRKLLASVELDEKRGDKWHDYRGKMAWTLARVRHYSEKTGLTPEAILDAWESKRDYWYMNFYQECNQPEIKEDSVRVFETASDLLESVGKTGFRCPACAGVSKSPYTCDTGVRQQGKVCDWKVYGLFGHMGKGLSVFIKDQVALERIFMPVAWETNKPEPGAGKRPKLKDMTKEERRAYNKDAMARHIAKDPEAYKAKRKASAEARKAANPEAYRAAKKAAGVKWRQNNPDYYKNSPARREAGCMHSARARLSEKASSPEEFEALMAAYLRKREARKARNNASRTAI